MDELVQQLTKGDHPVTVGGSRPSLADFQKRLSSSGYVFITFSETRGGTDLGMRVDKQATDVSRADFARGEGVVHVEGVLTLNYVAVRCVAEIDLHTLHGTGRLVLREEAPI